MPQRGLCTEKEDLNNAEPRNVRFFSYILPSYLFGQPCLIGQYGIDVIGEPAHVPIPSNFTLQCFKSQQIKEKCNLTLCCSAYQPIIDAVRTVLMVKSDSAG